MSVRRYKTVNLTDLRDKNVLVTGAASGIGRALAFELACRGATLFLCDRNSCADVVQEIRTSGGVVALFEAFDISSYESVERFGAGVHSMCESLDMVFNVAGVSSWANLENLEIGQARRMIEINALGPLNVLKVFGPAMKKRKNLARQRGQKWRGFVINVSSAAGLIPLPLHTAYAMSKYALRGMSDVLRIELQPFDIAVHLVCPGAVDTNLVNTLETPGVDRTTKKVQRLIGAFRKIAQKPEQVVGDIISGIENGRYLIAPRDIRFAFWLVRKHHTPYDLTIQAANYGLTKVMKGGSQ